MPGWFMQKFQRKPKEPRASKDDQKSSLLASGYPTGTEEAKEGEDVLTPLPSDLNKPKERRLPRRRSAGSGESTESSGSKAGPPEAEASESKPTSPKAEAGEKKRHNRRASIGATTCMPPCIVLGNSAESSTPKRSMPKKSQSAPAPDGKRKSVLGSLQVAAGALDKESEEEKERRKQEKMKKRREEAEEELTAEWVGKEMLAIEETTSYKKPPISPDETIILGRVPANNIVTCNSFPKEVRRIEDKGTEDETEVQEYYVAIQEGGYVNLDHFEMYDEEDQDYIEHNLQELPETWQEEEGGEEDAASDDSEQRYLDELYETGRGCLDICPSFGSMVKVLYRDGFWHVGVLVERINDMECTVRYEDKQEDYINLGVDLMRLENYSSEYSTDTPENLGDMLLGVLETSPEPGTRVKILCEDWRWYVCKTKSVHGEKNKRGYALVSMEIDDSELMIDFENHCVRPLDFYGPDEEREPRGKKDKDSGEAFPGLFTPRRSETCANSALREIAAEVAPPSDDPVATVPADNMT